MKRDGEFRRGHSWVAHGMLGQEAERHLEPIRPSTMERRESSPALISELSIQTTWPAASRSSLMRSTIGMLRSCP